MFNISFGELFAFAVIALIILGPEKLPQALRTVLLKYRAVKNQINKIQNDLENELELIELKRIMQEELQKIKQNEEQLKQQLAQMQQDIESVQKSTITAVAKADSPFTPYSFYPFSSPGLKAPFLSHSISSHILREDQAA
ncbi:twin-arginine translocase subunit TatB [Acinetobacter sp. S40]|uniref:Sec-independent protein translocase protein TatB n=1 Tax=Acinetobacter sp. S40 TaxID=2767434 RepID=UPI00190C0519|nr:Sec-independent protein translocase protein TatB [Acinetobacter sp. S40]MBJ9984747.1 twin-arginine translocase subunit TatB [Acinetobacter sp. S40]